MISQGSEQTPQNKRTEEIRPQEEGREEYEKSEICEAQGREGESREAKIRVGKAWGRHKGEETTRGDAR